MSLKFIYGTYEHELGEAYPREFSLQPLTSDRGRKWGLRARLNIEGSFLSPAGSPLDAAAVDTRIAALDTAYADDYKDAGFLFANDTPTAHYLTTDSQYNLTGNRVLYKSWVHKSPAEFANTRTYNITIGADFVDSASTLIDYYEIVDFLGNGAKDWDYEQRWSGLPEYVEYATNTPIRAIQRGRLTSYTPYPNPPGPLWPTYEQGKRQRRRRKSPRYHGNPDLPNLVSHYVVEWAYYFVFPSPQTGNPNGWNY